MNKIEMLRILNKFKKILGLADYEITVNIELHSREDSLAESNVSLLEKTVDIKVWKEFSLKSNKVQKNILIHELIHSRIDTMNERIEKLKENEEEYLVNDLTRAIEKIR